MPAGRPTSYETRFCDGVIQHMSQGASIASFAADIEVARSTINKWMDSHPEFSEAVSIGKAKCAAWWEKAGRKIVLEGGSGPQATMITLGLKNMAAEDWREKTLIGSDPDNPLPAAGINVSGLSEATLREIAAMGVKS